MSVLLMRLFKHVILWLCVMFIHFYSDVNLRCNLHSNVLNIFLHSEESMNEVWSINKNITWHRDALNTSAYSQWMCLHMCKIQISSEEIKPRYSLTHIQDTMLCCIMHRQTHTCLLAKNFYRNPDNVKGRKRRCEHSSGIA